MYLCITKTIIKVNTTSYNRFIVYSFKTSNIIIWNSNVLIALTSVEFWIIYIYIYFVIMAPLLSFCRFRRVVESGWAGGGSDDEHDPRNRDGGLFLCGVPHLPGDYLLLLPEQPRPQTPPPLRSVKSHWLVESLNND